MISDAKSGSCLERFSGKSYTMWKDKLLTHVSQLDHLMRWDAIHWKRARGDLQNLLNQVLHNFFLSTLPDVVSSMDPCTVIRLLKKLTRSPWLDKRTLFAQRKKARDEINRKMYTFRYRYALAVVVDATAYKWYIVVKSLNEIPGEIRVLLKQLSVQFPFKVHRIRQI
ncbi:Hypothetical protein PHPALM_3349 [Phytophthora palmivora]|uniref:Uncharacterized protein n=1 Tax=Phytophthora palmivora TaxID=4796 RepID=A0A2P4YML9_9STRA|nr:Hypothetical protein PHPALM_3349 [Phytophthora palmivora]